MLNPLVLTVLMPMMSLEVAQRAFVESERERGRLRDIRNQPRRRCVSCSAASTGTSATRVTFVVLQVDELAARYTPARLGEMERHSKLIRVRWPDENTEITSQSIGSKKYPVSSPSIAHARFNRFNSRLNFATSIDPFSRAFSRSSRSSDRTPRKSNPFSGSTYHHQ